MISKRTVNKLSQFKEKFTIEKEENNKKNGEKNKFCVYFCMKNFDSVASLYPVSSTAFKLFNIIFDLANQKRVCWNEKGNSLKRFCKIPLASDW